ncbi:MAG: energy-coupling factor ABC transporter permease [Burkholderiaceae bacterium]|nr:energy-coupling factor ABC transporter permease [Burkholderiaceae bacterium]
MSQTAFPAVILWLGTAVSVAALVDAARRAQWTLPHAGQTTWALATVAFLVARQATVTMPGDVTLQYAGTAWLTLLLGYPRAVVSVATVMAIEAFLGSRSFAALGVDILFFAVAPAWLMWALARACRRRLPPNLFIFLLGVGFLGLFVAYALPLLAVGLIDALALGAQRGGADTASAHALGQQLRLALPYALLLSAGEAWIEGMLTTLLVVFAPDRVRLFDEAYYLARG